MPIYCYRTEAGYLLERVFRMGEAPEKIKDPVSKGFFATRDYGAEGVTGTVVRTEHRSKLKRLWPMTCYASGVHPSQAGELRQHLRERGCPTEVTKGGDPIYNSPAHRKKALKVRGMHDRNSFT